MTHRTPVILCVDDDEKDLWLLETTLASAGYAVVSATNGADALLAINNRIIDLVVLDIVLPDIDGFDVCRLIKGHPTLKRIPVIMVTILSAKEDRIKATQSGAEGFLSKPFDEVELLAKVKIILEVQQLNDRLRLLSETELSKNKALLKGVIDSSSSGIMAFKSVRNPEGEIVDFEWLLTNAVAERIAGRSHTDLLGKSLLQETPHSHPADLFKLFVNVVETGTPLDCERSFERRQTTAWGHIGAVKLSDGLVVTFTDITERKQTEQALIESEERFRKTLESMQEGCQIIGFDWRYLFINDAAARQGKLTRQELLGRTMMECYPGIENSEMFAVLQLSMAKRTSHTMLNEFIYPDGSRGWFELSIQPSPNGIFILASDITERKRAEAEIRQHLQQMTALREIDMSIAGSVDLHLTLRTILAHVTQLFDVNAAAILLLNPHTSLLEFAAGHGFRGRDIERSRLYLGEGHAGKAALERSVVHVADLRAEQDESLRTDLLNGEDFISYYAFPLIAKGQVAGVLEVFHRSLLDPGSERLDFLKTLAGQAAIALDSARLFDGLQRSNTELMLAYDATIEGWSRAMDLRDKETEGHTQRVTELTVRLSKAMGIGDEELSHIRRGALLHDIGKIGVPDGILLKPGPLTDEEWAAMKKHPTFAYEMLSPIRYLRLALDIPYCHHERWDGSGYPRGLKGEQIPLTARIFAVVDVWDALTSDRPYRPAWSRKKVLEHIQAGSGSHFDPIAVEQFLGVMGEIRE